MEEIFLMISDPLIYLIVKLFTTLFLGSHEWLLESVNKDKDHVHGVLNQGNSALDILDHRACTWCVNPEKLFLFWKSFPRSTVITCNLSPLQLVATQSPTTGNRARK